MVDAQVPPDARWRTLDTTHFRVNYMAGLDSLANRTAARAEWAYGLLARELVEPPRGKIDIVLTDAVDLANGSATPLPTNRIVLYADPPTDVAELAFTTDWLELLVLHELVHIFHLDEAGGVWAALRAVLGRNAALFPHAYAPSWLPEGLATYYESRFTPGGRVRGTQFDMILRAAVLEDDLFSIDRVSGNPRSWPSGSSRYVYGALFLDHLARRSGEDAFPRFIEEYGEQLVPYLLDRAARRSGGVSFRLAWDGWADSLRAHYRAVADSLRAAGVTEPEILSPAGRDAYFPRFSPDGRFIAYAAATGREQPSIRLIEPGGAEREVAPQSLLGPASWRPDGSGLVYGDLQFRGPYRIHADLWTTSLAGGERRLTRSRRLSQPDIHPDGRTVLAVRDTGGTNVLVAGDPQAGEPRTLTEPSLDVHWATPRWSPDGDRIAAIRWSPGGMQDLVVLRADGTLLRQVTADRAVESAPAWSPDGRYLLFSSDRTGIPNLFALDLADGRLLQVTNVLTGAFEPDVSPDGRWIALSYYRSDGYHIARVPFEPGGWRAAPPTRVAALPVEGGNVHPPVAGEGRPYSPWPTVRPAAWSFLTSAGTELGSGGGAALGGEDVVRRHQWAAQGLWYLEGGRFEGGGAYRYQGWGNPAIELTVSQDWRVVCGEGSATCAGDEPVPSALLRRDREASVSLLWVRQRTRSTGWLRPALTLERRRLSWKDVDAVEGVALGTVPADVSARLELGRSSVRSFALTVGPAAGISLTAAAEAHRYLEPLPGDAGAAGYLRSIARARGYRSVAIGGSAHVLAMRVDGGAELGSRSPGFDVGGARGGAVPGAFDVEVFGGGVSFPVRGYPEGVQFGNRAVTATAEYRFPLLRVERGLGLIPVYLDRITGDLFADAGTAWCGGACPPRLSAAPRDPRPLTSLGAEAVIESRLGFHTSVPLRLGVALPLQQEGAPEFYLRVGRSF